jgi:hypothetical protein
MLLYRLFSHDGLAISAFSKSSRRKTMKTRPGPWAVGTLVPWNSGNPLGS